ncbi:hypothetical protein TNCV_2364861 [Trichonephila clavipes]|nr:hypothetical protein TNCV_2364861 [Trichonephila clavipes]
MSCYWEYRPLRTKACGLCMMIRQNIFRLRCEDTSMLHIPGGGIGRCRAVALPARSPDFNPLDFFLLGLHVIVCVEDAGGYNGGSHGTDRHRFN